MTHNTTRASSGSFSTAAAFVVGVPAGIALLWALTVGPLHHPDAERYLHHPVEKVELIMFCAAVAALGAKWLSAFRERAALAAEILPAWDGKAVPPAHARTLMETHADSIRQWRGTWIGRRYAAVLDFVKSRGSANELDDHLRTLADADAMNLEASYALTRFITWAIPILGFLGTVLGITAAITGVTPEKLEKDMSAVTGGLSLAFDATALGLALTMVLMFLSFLVDRKEQRILEEVDIAAETELGHRFLRTGADNAPILAAMEATGQHMLETADALVRRQSELWARSLEQVAVAGRQSVQEQHRQLVASLEAAVGSALARHAERMSQFETQMLGRQEKLVAAVAQLAGVLESASKTHQNGLTDVAGRLANQTAALAQLQHAGGELTRLQESLAKNLDALAGAGAFEEAVQSLTAAIHLLTSRVQPPKKAA
jgi:biopolymer transport protein ExbB/TolQ